MTPAQRFSTKVAAVNTWILAGLFLDGWWHIHDPGLETFFTPWHGVMYTGVLAAVWLLVDERRRRRDAGLAPFPPGYRLSAVGGAVFLGGAVADMAWHEALGIEVGVEALLSPPHLALAVAGVLVFGGPLRAALRGGGAAWPAVAAVTQALALLGFFTQYANPFVHRYATLPMGVGVTETDARQALGIAAVLLSAALVAGAILLLARAALPLGAVTVVVAGSVAFLVSLRGTWALLPAALVAGVLGDLAARRGGPRAAAVVAPALLHAGAFATLAAQGTLTWSLELVSGGVLLAGAVGALAGLLVAPVPAPIPDAPAPLADAPRAPALQA